MKNKRYYFLCFSLLLTSCNNSSTFETLANKEEFLIYENELKIYGNLYTPLDFSSDNSYSLIIMSHSADINSDSLDSYGYRAASLSYLSYSFDYPSDNKKSRSDKIENPTIFKDVDTLSYLVDYFFTIPYINKIYLFGTSQGGLISSIVANNYNEIIQGLIMFYPAFNIPELLQIDITLDEEYRNELNNYNVYDHIGSFTKDVLIVHGTKDFIVPSSYSEKANEIYSSCTLQLIEGANHGFNKENYYFNDKYDSISWNYVEEYLLNHF
ncbi:MAG: alpha/beta hydrolase family protein [Bacilli bacterium]